MYPRLALKINTRWQAWALAAFIVLPSIAALSLRSKLVASAAVADFPRPDHTKVAEFARWLAHSSDWGTISYISHDDDSSSPYPFADVVSHSDGPIGNPTGRLLYYLTPMYEFVADKQESASVSYTIAESQLHPEGCGSLDPENPKCGKMTVLGSLVPVPDEELTEVGSLVFSRHPEMEGWPASHQWGFYELKINKIYLFDWIGGEKVISAEEYFAADVPRQHIQL